MKINKQESTNYLKYTGIAFQMIAIICVFAFLGNWADRYFKHATPWVTALGCVVGVCVSIYQVIRQLK